MARRATSPIIALLPLAIIALLVTVALTGCGSTSEPAPPSRVTIAQTALVAVTPSITDQLTTNKASIEITGLPAGTEHIGVAVMQTLAGAGVKYLTIPASQHTYTPPAATPVVDVQAFTGCCAGTGHATGNWAGRLQTVPGGIEPPPPPPPPPPPSSTLFGIVGCCWGSGELTDLKALHAQVVRAENPSTTNTAAWEGLGARVIALENHYSPAGVSGVNTTEYVNKVVSYVRANPRVYAVEVLNEPGGSWFWGGSSESSTNREAYGRLLIAVHQALVNNFGAGRPLELASWDGGHDSSNAWGEAWSKNATALADVDGVTSHPYGGTGNRSTAILGNRGLVERAHASSHKPDYITEVGFPTKGPTGDSLQYTETEQARAIYQLGVWASHTGYIPAVTFYGYRDSQEGGGYGIVRHNGTRKPAFTSLQQLIAGQACTVCS